MIKNKWYAILESKELKKDTPLYTMRMGKKLCLWRDTKNNIACIEDKCCHRGASIGAGFISGDNVACPFHGFEYDKNGKVVLIPANLKDQKVPYNFEVESFIVREEYDFIWLWYGDKDKVEGDVSFPDSLKNKKFSYQSLKDNWTNHYSRCIENQLDIVHVPFVHKTTIGKYAKKVIENLVVEVEDEKLIRFYTKNEKNKDDYKKYTYLEFYFPNTWQNIITESMRVFACFAPVDDNNTVIYIRYYQKIITTPVFRDIFNFSGIKYSKKVLEQDKNVVRTQSSTATKHNTEGEHLIMGDKPIIEYRNLRDKLKAK